MTSETARLLAGLSQLDSVEVTPVGNADHVAERVPQWCEITLGIERDGRVQVIPLTRHDGELIIECLHVVLHPGSSKSPVERLWAELDETMDYLMVDNPEEEDKATARALALAIAMLTLPYAEEPDVAAIKTEAVVRWEARQ